MGWLVYRLTDSTRALGVIDFMAAIPTVLLIPVTSMLLPKMDPRMVLLVTQPVLMLCAALVGVLTFTNYISYSWLIGIAFFMSLANAFDMPVRQTLVVSLVDNKEDVGNAVALNSTLFNLARLVGPTVAGMAIYRVGEAICFLLNAASYSATIFAVKSMKLPQHIRQAGTPQNLRESMAAVLRLLRDFPPFTHVLMILTVCGVFGVPYLSLMPAMARTVLGGSPQTMGVLMTAVGIGALIGSLIMAARKSPVGLDRWAIMNSISFGAAVFAFSFSRSVWFAVAVLPFAGFSMVTMLIACNTFLQAYVTDEGRSALMTLYIASIVGLSSIGSVITGQIGEYLGASGALRVGGIMCVILSGYYSYKLHSYRKMICEASVRLGYLCEDVNKV